jgi:hypothetical protein
MDNMTPHADKWLHADGSVTTLAGELILPADAARAEEYQRREPIAAKWLLSDGSISGALPLLGDSSTSAEATPFRYFFAETTTAYSTVNKVLTGLPEGYRPQSGDYIFMTYKTATQNSATNLKFAIPDPDSGAEVLYPILFDGTAINTITGNWRPNAVIPFYFDGASFHQMYLPRITDTDTNTTYAGFFEIPLTGFYLKINPERAIDRYQLCLERTDGTFDKACTAAYSTSTSKAVNTATDFKVDGLIWFNNSANTYSANGTYSGGSTNLMQTYQSSYLMNYALNGNAGLTAYSWLYLVGIPNADNPMIYRLDATSPTSWYTTTPPTAEDGKVYIRLGRYHTGSVSSLMAEHPAYWFKDGTFRPYLTQN